jgi:hypothetical protein
MVDGKLVELDTPARLKRKWVPGAVFALASCGDQRAFRRLLLDQPDVVDVLTLRRRMV